VWWFRLLECWLSVMADLYDENAMKMAVILSTDLWVTAYEMTNSDYLAQMEWISVLLN